MFGSFDMISTSRPHYVRIISQILMSVPFVIPLLIVINFSIPVQRLTTHFLELAWVSIGCFWVGWFLLNIVEKVSTTPKCTDRKEIYAIQRKRAI